MPALSRWMIGYGLLLIACDVVDAMGWVSLGLDGAAFFPGWGGGLIMIANGLAAAQRRRSLRMTGFYAGTFPPLALAGVFTWHAAKLWQSSPIGVIRTAAIGSSLLALASIGIVWLVFVLRPREGIASRGYAVTLPSRRRGPSESASDFSEEAATRSELR